MHCTFCGTAVADPKLSFCAVCGRPLGEAAAMLANTQTAANVPAAAPPAMTTAPAGVGGWLLLLCILLTIILPCYVLSNLLRTIRYANESANYFFFGLDILLLIAGFVAGLWLWQRKPKGVLLAKGVLIAHALFPIVTFITFFVRYGTSIGIGLFLSAYTILPVVISLAWYFYLIRSRRVHNTYFAA